MSRYRTAAPAMLEQRGEPRRRVSVSRATVHRNGLDEADAELHDLSIYGCKLRSPLDHSPDERLWLHLNGSLPIAATVVWSEDGMVGCRFQAPIGRTLVREFTLPIA